MEILLPHRTLPNTWVLKCPSWARSIVYIQDEWDAVYGCPYNHQYPENCNWNVSLTFLVDYDVAMAKLASIAADIDLHFYCP